MSKRQTKYSGNSYWTGVLWKEGDGFQDDNGTLSNFSFRVAEFSIVDNAMSITWLANRMVIVVQNLTNNLGITVDPTDFTIGDELIFVISSNGHVNIDFNDSNWFVESQNSPVSDPLNGNTIANLVFTFDGEKFVSTYEHC